jgi:hypothetical protein
MFAQIRLSSNSSRALPMCVVSCLRQPRLNIWQQLYGKIKATKKTPFGARAGKDRPKLMLEYDEIDAEVLKW